MNRYDTSRRPTSSVRKANGGVLPIGYQPENVRAGYVDEYTGEILDPHLVRAVIMEGLNYFNEKVWEVESRDGMQKEEGHVFVRSRWVL